MHCPLFDNYNCPPQYTLFYLFLENLQDIFCTTEILNNHNQYMFLDYEITIEDLLPDHTISNQNRIAKYIKKEILFCKFI